MLANDRLLKIWLLVDAATDIRYLADEVDAFRTEALDEFVETYASERYAKALLLINPAINYKLS